MREIKFRVWFPNIKKFMPYDEKVFNLMDVTNGKLVCNCDDWLESNNDLEYYNDEGYELNQYTGLKDKNGKEIYEGDMFFDIPGRLCVIEYSDIFACYMMLVENRQGTNIKKSDGLGCPLHHTNRNNIEIIGNIYENKIEDFICQKE